MMEVALAGVIMNGTVAALLWRFSGDVNIRSVFLHMLGDTLSTAAVIAGGAAILFTHMSWVDPVLSLIIAAMILWSSVGIIRETLNILLEGTPRGIQLPAVREAMELRRRRPRRPRSARLEPGRAVARARQPRHRQRDARIGVLTHPRSDQLPPPRPLPHHSHHHPVRDHRLRDHPRLQLSSRS